MNSTRKPFASGDLPPDRWYVRACMMLPVCCLTAVAHAGPDWEEIGDAGSLRDTAQVLTGTGSIGSIKGKTGGTSPLAGVIDQEDMYLFQITEPTIFCAFTIPPRNGPQFDTQLFLFSAQGIGVVGNDDGADPPLSSLTPIPDDGSGTTLLNPGIYYLAISGGNGPTGGRDPISAGGLIFNQASLTEVSGPDGPGGGEPVSGWTGSGATGDYQIILCGSALIAGVPTLGEAAMLLLAVGFAVVGWMMVRARDQRAPRASVG